MDYITCRDSVFNVIDTATKSFGTSYIVTEQSIEKVEEICDMVDVLANEACCSHIDVSVDSLSKYLTIDIECDTLELYDGRSNGFFELIKKVDSFKFLTTKGGLLKIEFNIYWIWEGAGER